MWLQRVVLVVDLVRYWYEEEENADQTERAHHRTTGGMFGSYDNMSKGKSGN